MYTDLDSKSKITFTKWGLILIKLIDINFNREIMSIFYDNITQYMKNILIVVLIPLPWQ
jgi:hypothetical protein